MSFLKKSVSVLAVFAVIPAAYALTARPSVATATTASRRLPTLSAYVTSQSGTASDTVGDNGTSGSMTVTECVDAYTECMRADDVCGSEFEECTTTKLFHGQMPKCLNVLSQCSGAGVEKLFGTSSISALGNMYDNGEYVYPRDGSDMGQWISAAYINNQYDTATCVKRYTSCLQRDSVCGADFELCTDKRSFKKQALLCDSTLARCQEPGIIEMLGKSSWRESINDSADTIGGRVGTMIEDGAKLAAMNAVSTCYKVVEQCFLGACDANPLRCVEGTALSQINAAEATFAGETINYTKYDKDGDGITSQTEINRYLRTSCLDTIGSNKYCHMTFLETNPKDKDLSDPDLQEDVFAAAVDQRKKYVDSKIKDMMIKFDTQAKDKCAETIRTCAMRTCGEGVGSVCYTKVFSKEGQNQINGANTYDEIKRGCESIVNTDTNCQYAVASLNGETAYTYEYNKKGAFEKLFPRYTMGTTGGRVPGVSFGMVPSIPASDDPIGVVASLNSSLATNYNDAAIANMKKRCQTIATNCVKSMCGTDYVNCYRNRTDIVSDLTKTGENGAAFDKSMNKVGGVLDYTIVLGLCMNTVKNADVCDEHLKITSARLDKSDEHKTTWGANDSTRDAWVDAGGAKTLETVNGQIQAEDGNGNLLCTNKDGDECPCGEYYGTWSGGEAFNELFEIDNKLCDKPVYTTLSEYKEKQAADTLFRELITDIEYEAQAKYNAKLTKQQNMCLAANEGAGIIGTNDLGSTFAWVKLKNNKVPTSYSTAGLKTSQFVNSNDLYGSFCRVRVTMQSDDPAIQEVLAKGKDWSTAYFAAGDAFTCGSWIGTKNLETLANKVAKTARDKAKFEWENDGSRNWYWAVPAASILGTLGGGYLDTGIQSGDIFGGLTGKTKVDDGDENCVEYAKKAFNAAKNDMASWVTAYSYAEIAVSHAKAAGYTNAILDTWNDDLSSSASKSTGASPNHECNGKSYGTNDPKWCVDQMSGNDAVATLKARMQSVQDICKNAVLDTQNKGNNTSKASKSSMWTGAVVGGALAFTVIQSARDTRLDGAELDAYNAFYQDLGQHIHCYIGGTEAGSFGDVVVTSME